MNSTTPARPLASPPDDPLPAPFSAWDLIEESSHTPAHRSGGSVVYHSAILGTEVARASVLAVINLLAEGWLEAEKRSLSVEAVGPDGVVISDAWRRFHLPEEPWGDAHRLCDQPRCPQRPTRYRTLCDAHTIAGGAETVRAQTSLFAECHRQERDWMHHVEGDLMTNLMQAAVGLPAVAHAQYFAEQLHLADPDDVDDWYYEEKTPEINADRERLQRAVAPRPRTQPIGARRGVPRRIGPLDPLQLPGNPGDLKLEFSCEPERLSPWWVHEDAQWWSVSVHHRPADDDLDPVLGQIGRLALARLDWGQEDSILGSVHGEQYHLGRLAADVFAAWENPDSEMRQLGLHGHGDLLVLLHVQLEKVWRGFGLGAYLAAQAVEFLGAGCRLAAADVDTEDSVGGRLVQAAGFHPLDRGLAVRKCVAPTNDVHRRQLALQLAQVSQLAHPQRAVSAENPF
ncbi:hypothetical protein [Streptomyces sp. VNUA24]|uniref:hypothetical protein n=1 Tax=Streptomyces sp. VNUA24 TaxID=3031131 RepID=UPI0023B84A76|nr:hypothetical protein [Streptomyces sp. VNUA24]WEH12234.1 hypothetical protein PYR72_00340 [Streptomyces sp. VNUA24]